MIKNYTISFLFFFLCSCNSSNKSFDASGYFEAEEVIISAESNGQLKYFHISEGEILIKGKQIGVIDTCFLHLQKLELSAVLSSVKSRIPNVKKQTAFYKQQLQIANIKLIKLKKEKERIYELIKAKSGTQKQLDDISSEILATTTQIQAIKNKKIAQKSALQVQINALNSESKPVYYKIKQVQKQIEKSVITNPVKGTVLSKFVHQHEFVNIGKPLYSIADLSHLILRVYVTQKQLSTIMLNSNVTVITDDQTTVKGKIIWISNMAEFTPKTIQTKEERENRVFAIKIMVNNTANLKIGMFASVKFNK